VQCLMALPALSVHKLMMRLCYCTHLQQGASINSAGLPVTVLWITHATVFLGLAVRIPAPALSLRLCCTNRAPCQAHGWISGRPGLPPWTSGALGVRSAT
jgi:hypothetical protein